MKQDFMTVSIDTLASFNIVFGDNFVDNIEC